MRGGAGLVWLGVPESIYEITAVKNDEAMPFPLPCDERGRLSAEAVPEVEERLERMSCLAIGPGLGRSEGVTELVQGALAASRVPTVVDADALWALSRDMSVLENAACPAVLTPHVHEMSGIDTSKYSGLAWGMGLERAAMRRFKIADLRLMFENDVRFLEQF